MPSSPAIAGSSHLSPTPSPPSIAGAPGAAFDLAAAIAAFVADPSAATLELPAGLSAQQRRSSKALVEPYPDIRCDSFGFGCERRLHLFRKSHAQREKGLAAALMDDAEVDQETLDFTFGSKDGSPVTPGAAEATQVKFTFSLKGSESTGPGLTSSPPGTEEASEAAFGYKESSSPPVFIGDSSEDASSSPSSPLRGDAAEASVATFGSRERSSIPQCADREVPEATFGSKELVS